MGASVLFEGGRVFTGRRYVEALLIENGRVVAAGTSTAVQREAPTGVERVALEGALAIPALGDAHLHVADLARLSEGPDLEGVHDRDALLARLAGWASEHRVGPVVGRRFDLARVPAHAWPTAPDLDRAIADRPVVVYDGSGHVAILNSRALELLELDAPVAGLTAAGVARDAQGRPTGVLSEEALRRLSAVLEGPPVSRESMGRTLDHLASLGLAWVGAMSVERHELGLLKELSDGNDRGPKIRAYVRAGELLAPGAPPIPPPSGRCSVVGAKAFLDGAFGPRTASLSAPYSDAPSDSGTDTLDDAGLTRVLERSAELGLVPALHAIGDRAVRRAALALGRARRPEGVAGRIEHVSLTPPPVLSALAEARPILVVQPGFLLTDTWLKDRLGAERARWAYTFRTLRALGLDVAGSSDAPYGPLDPWEGIRAAMTRTDDAGRSANPEQGERLSAEEALALYTTGAARALGEPSGGSLEPGASGDLVVLRQPTLAAAVASGAPVAQTWIDGQLSYPALP